MVLQGQLIEWVGKSGWGLNSTIFGIISPILTR